MIEYHGYAIEQNPKTGRWEVFWKGRKQPVDFARESDAEDYLDELLPTHRW